MVDRELCGRCGGLGKIMTLDEPPEDPLSGEGWEECPRCKGSRVEMAARHFEVYFRFPDEVDARAFMDRAAADPVVNSHGIRAVESEPSIFEKFGFVEDDSGGDPKP
jgi:hypothetical protein